MHTIILQAKAKAKMNAFFSRIIPGVNRDWIKVLTSRVCHPSTAQRRTVIWQRVNAMFPLQDPDLQFWWCTTGTALAILLQEARYSIEAQYRNLIFYAAFVVPELGPASSQRPRWRSFMTDDATPIEFSWDWGWAWGENAPTIRYSIEPIGPHAGTAADPLNASAGARLMRQLQRVVPDTDLQWFEHFWTELLSFVRHDRGGREGHESRFFIAFDLHQSRVGVVVKAYFVPAFKAAETGQSKLAVVSQAIARLPNHQPADFRAFDVLRVYMQMASGNPPLDVEILAIDCMAPSLSRLKVYLRSRLTSFDSVCATMTLGGRLSSLRMEKGLEELRELWNVVLENSRPLSPSAELPSREHRTAGILYNFEIRQGQALPVPKVYIPVRHYGQNDYSIAEGLRTYLRRRRQSFATGSYVHALKSIVSSRRLKDSCGVQTYIGCTIKDGSLKLISYINPQVHKLFNHA